MSGWPIEMTPPPGFQPTELLAPGEAIVLNEDTLNVAGEFDSYGTAQAWIADTQDHQERVGLPVSSYRVLPVRATPGGRDIR